MTISRAFTYIFEDPDWVSKIVILVILVFFGLFTSPLLIGFAVFALLFGYQGALMRNVRQNATPILPPWADWGRLISDGFPVLIAYLIYMLPNLLIGAFTGLTTAAAGNTSIVSGGVSLAIACCLFPLVLGYNLVALPMFTIAQGRYAETRRFAVFFELGALWDVFRTHFDAVATWWTGLVIALVALTVINLIPCFGWVIGAALVYSVTGALGGMLHAATFDKPKRKNT
ncbi:MAG: DUF4013 domain-containing protein [bacterium]|nr:DUF4013 domain-containing protein [bacterium]